MSTTRREFTLLLGAAVVAPFAPEAAASVPAPFAGMSLWERAEAEVQQTGQVSREIALTLLDNQGPRGIYAEEQHFEAFRAALTRKIQDHKILRDFELPDELEPIVSFTA